MAGSRSLALVLVSALLLVSPVSAIAQSAGDEQYVDPLSGLTDKESNSGGGSNSSGSSGSGSNGGSQDTGAAVGEDTAQVAGTAEEDAKKAESELARTGIELPLLAGVGLLLLAGGIGLRRLAGERY